MASDETDDSDGAGCGQYGCGCAGVGLAVATVVLSVAVAEGTSFSILTVLLYPLFLLVPGAIVGFLASKIPLGNATRRGLGVLGKYTFLFGLLCLLSAIGITLRPGGFSFEEQVPAEGGTVGPITIEKENMRMGVEVEQYIDEGPGRRYQRWSFVTIELLDEDKEYLSSFGGEFWHYAGYDDGYWEEDDEEYEATLQVPSPGTYYLRLQTESNVDSSQLSSIDIAMNEQRWWGNPAPLQIAGYLAVFLGVVLVIIPSEWASSLGGPSLAQQLSEGVEFEFRGRTWSVGGHAHYEYDDWQADEWTVQSTDVSVKRPRYLEHEYEADSDWEEWFWSTPVDMDALRCTDADDAEMAVSAYASDHEELPRRIEYDGAQFRHDAAGTTRRDGRPLPYRTYQEMWEAGNRSITIEGELPGELSAVVTESIAPADVSVQADEGDEGKREGVEAGGGDV